MKFAAIQLIVANFVFKMILKKKLYIFLVFVFGCFQAESQNTFHKVYNFNDSMGIISNVKISGTNYVIGSSTGKASREQASVITIDSIGNVVSKYSFKDSNRNESIGFGASKIQQTSDGKFWFLYSSRIADSGWKILPKILRFSSANGFESKEEDTLIKGYFQCIDNSKLYLDELNDKYYVVEVYNYKYLIDTASTLPLDVGTFILCYQMSTDSLLYIRRYNFSTTMVEKPRRVMVNFLPYSDGTFLLVLWQDQQLPSEYCRILFYHLDENCEITQTKIVQDTPYSFPGFGSTFLNNQKDLLISYTSSELITPPNNTAYWGLTPSVARLDSNFNIIWKKELGGIQFNPYQIASKHLFNKFSIVGDTAFVGAHFRVFYHDDDTLTAHGTLRVMNARTDNGEINWLRDYNFFTDSSGLENSLYEVRDIEQTSDGGFIMVGEVLNYDSLNVGAPGQLGYVLKTNCLGFLGDPQAGFTAVPDDSMGIHFTNTSLMGGSYLWDFGDGTTMQTGEFDSAAFDSAQAAVFHTYSDTGIFEVTLIAYGCNGANDTLRTTVHVSKNGPVEPVNPNITNYMAIGPNPVKSGESIAVYVGNLPSENCTLSFFDERGKVVLEHRITLSNSTNIIVIPFSSGVYQFVLRDGSKELEMEKVIVI